MNMVNAGEVAQVAIVERWQWWMTALKDPAKIGSADLQIHANEYQLGYYRCRRKDGPWEPVGIYPDDDGVVVGLRNGKPVSDIQELFLWACRHPISYEAYVKALEGGGFDDEPAPARGIGDNSGDADPLDAISIELAGEIEQVRDFMRQPVETQAQADRLGIWAKRLTDLAKKADNHRVVEKQPHLDASRAVDDKWREPITEAKNWAAKAKKHIEPFLIAQRRAEEERQRKAREEAAAAARAAAEAARKAREAEQAEQQDEQAKEAAQREAERLAAQARQAEKDAAERKVNAGRTGARVSVRTEKVGVVTDYAKAAAALVAMKHPDMVDTIDKLAQRAAKAGMPFDGMAVEEREVVR